MQESILLVGKPNSGKSLLFNRLTGLGHKVANYPGATVQIKSGPFHDYSLVDYPGAYSLDPLTDDEKVAVEKFHQSLGQEKTSLVVCNLEATRPERSLVFGLHAQRLASQFGKSIVFVINMVDELEGQNIHLDLKKLEEEIGSPVFAVSAKTNKGVNEFNEKIRSIAKRSELFRPKKISLTDEEIRVRAREISHLFGLHEGIFLKRQNRMDTLFLHPIFGGPIFLLIMAFFFQSIFTWSAPLMDLVEEGINGLGLFVTSSMSDGVGRDFILDALFGGFGSFLVFVPQIVILSFFIGVFEDSGYLARVALICHRPLSLFGLSGKSFIPFLTGHACAIPATYAARTIESKRKRFLTLITIPLMACSARLPVYALLVTALIPATPILGGFFGIRGLVFTGLYLMGLFFAFLVSLLLDRFLKKTGQGEDTPFVIELPPYRLPHWSPLVQKSLQIGKDFVFKAGPMIFFVSLSIWVLGYFPGGAGSLESSWLSQLGRFIEPLFAPLGLDWRYGVAILMSFLAREVFVGTLGTLYGIEGADENITGLATQIQRDGLEISQGLALLVFYALALQCVSTVAVLKRETSSKVALWTFVGHTFLAYVLAVGTFNMVNFFMAAS